MKTTSLVINSIASLRCDLSMRIKHKEIKPAKICLEADVSTATLYNFISGKVDTPAIIDWYLEHYGDNFKVDVIEREV